MVKSEIEIIDKRIEELIKNKTEYSFQDIKKKIEEILKNVDLFIVDNELNSKAVDLYLKNVISQRNNLKKEQEETKINNTKERKYFLIETICKKLEFESQEELIKKVEELEKKTVYELNEIINNL